MKPPEEDLEGKDECAVDFELAVAAIDDVALRSRSGEKGLDSLPVLAAEVASVVDLDGDDIATPPPDEIDLASARRRPVAEGALDALVMEMTPDLVKDEMLEENTIPVRWQRLIEPAGGRVENTGIEPVELRERYLLDFRSRPVGRKPVADEGIDEDLEVAARRLARDAGRRLTRWASPKFERIQVLLPVPRGPKRKNDVGGGRSSRGNIDTKFTVKLVSMSTGRPVVSSQVDIHLGSGVPMGVGRPRRRRQNAAALSRLSRSVPLFLSLHDTRV
ncbi:MAG TPA: hypothetical protein VMT00_02025 [Thermoanaerobaculia bacterium]|nr:hypothetical protein [Thermoanaerobaculia bacterium]